MWRFSGTAPEVHTSHTENTRFHTHSQPKGSTAAAMVAGDGSGTIYYSVEVLTSVSAPATLGERSHQAFRSRRPCRQAVARPQRWDGPVVTLAARTAAPLSLARTPECYIRFAEKTPRRKTEASRVCRPHPRRHPRRRPVDG